MNEFSPERLEAELRRQKPAAPPPELLRKLIAAEPSAAPAAAAAPKGRRALREGSWRELWLAFRWWLAPAAALIIGVLVILKAYPLAVTPPRKGEAAASAPAVKADDVRIDSELVSSFDTVARLPSGEPVRYRCREWVDEVTLRDRVRGVMVAQRSPRVEVIPVRFESY